MKKETNSPATLREIAIDALAKGDLFTLGRVRDYREKSKPNRMVHQVEGDPAFYDALGKVTTIPDEYREYHDEGRIVLWDFEKVLDIDAALYWSMHHGFLKDN